MAGVWLITGGAGFIGSHLVRAAVERAARVRVLDSFATGFRENLAELAGRIELIEGDVRNAEACAAACRGAETVFHLAALPSVARSMAHPRETFEVNADGTLNMLLAARQAGVRRFIYAASSSAYGSSEELPKREAMPPAPVSPYAASKASGEVFVSTFARAYGMETVNLRYFSIFGPRQDPKSAYAGVVAAFAARMLRGERPIIYGDGGQSRDFTYVANVVHANLLAAEAPALPGEVVNVGCGRAASLNDLVAAFNAILATHLEPVYEPVRAGDVRHSLADLSRARALLGYEPQVELREGLRRTTEWHRGVAAGGR